jgi:hypothetical protein
MIAAIARHANIELDREAAHEALAQHVFPLLFVSARTPVSCLR